MSDNRPLITLMTDFGCRDTYVGQMKGVIYQIVPGANVIDLTHAIPPQNVRAAAVILDDVIDTFGPDTVHVVVVDPGVGTSRKAIALASRLGRFIAPDNGVLSQVLKRDPDAHAVHLNNTKYHRQAVSSTFHGRDIFAPAGAHLAAGVLMADLGEPVTQLQQIDLPEPTPTEQGLTLHVLWIDHFGNLFTNLRQSEAAGRPLEVQLSGSVSVALASTFADVSPGEPVVYFGSSGRLEVAIRDGNAANALNLKVGDPIQLCWSDS